jgi:hypothetical protein
LQKAAFSTAERVRSIVAPQRLSLDPDRVPLHTRALPMQPLHSWTFAIAARSKAFLSSISGCLNPTLEERSAVHGGDAPVRTVERNAANRAAQIADISDVAA